MVLWMCLPQNSYLFGLTVETKYDFALMVYSKDQQYSCDWMSCNDQPWSLLPLWEADCVLSVFIVYNQRLRVILSHPSIKPSFNPSEFEIFQVSCLIGWTCCYLKMSSHTLLVNLRFAVQGGGRTDNSAHRWSLSWGHSSQSLHLTAASACWKWFGIVNQVSDSQELNSYFKARVWHLIREFWEGRRSIHKR